MSKHDSWITNLFKKGDLMYHVMGGEGSKYDEIMNKKLPREVNRVGSQIMKPISKLDKKTNPFRKIGIVDKISTEVETRPGDAIAAAIGAVAGGGALAGAMGGGASAGAGAGAAGSGSSTGALSTMAQYGQYAKNAGRVLNGASKIAGGLEGNQPTSAPIASTPKPTPSTTSEGEQMRPMSAEARKYLELKEKNKDKEGF